METRNHKVRRGLEALYGPQVTNGRLHVFTVSNTEYWENREQPRDEALQHLRLSGILDIRRHCLSIVAESQFRVVTNYIRGSIPAVLNDTALWVESGAGSRGAEEIRAVRNVLNTLENQLQTVIKPHCTYVVIYS